MLFVFSQNNFYSTLFRVAPYSDLVPSFSSALLLLFFCFSSTKSPSRGSSSSQEEEKQKYFFSTTQYTLIAHFLHQVVTNYFNFKKKLKLKELLTYKRSLCASDPEVIDFERQGIDYLVPLSKTKVLLKSNAWVRCAYS